MSNKKAFYIHLGIHKTGTSALQKFFFDNKKNLKSRGILYDKYNHKSLNHNYLAKGEGWDNVEFDPNSSYLLSGEDFYHRILAMHELINSKLHDFDLCFIIYLKRQDLMKQSVYNQIVKMAGYYKDIHSDNHYNYDYYSFLMQLKERFPNANVLVRPYEKRQLKAGSIFVDFLDTINIDLDKSFNINKDVINPSLNREKLELARCINMLSLSPQLRRKFNKVIAQTSIAKKEASIFRDQGILSPGESKKFLEMYSDGNRKIAEKFLGRTNKVLFYENVKEDPHWTRYDSIDANTAYDILKDVYAIDSSVVKELALFLINQSLSLNKIPSSSSFLSPIVFKLLSDN